MTQRRPQTRRPTAAISLLLVVSTVLSGWFAAPSAAQTGDDKIQILNLGEDESGWITFELALPFELQTAPVAANFALTENDAPQNLQIQPLSSVVDVIVVLDTSGSMQEGSALEAAKTAAASLIARLPADARVGVVGFGETASVISTPGLDRAATLDALAALEAQGETALWDALGQAAGLAADLNADRPYVVLLSDGGDTASVNLNQTDAVALLTQSGAGLYAVALETAESDQASLQASVAAVGGQYLQVTNVNDLDGLYADIGSRLTNRYQAGYQSTPGLQRSIIVSVADPSAPRAVATARKFIEGTVPGTEGAAPAAVNPAGDKTEAASLPIFTPVGPGFWGSSQALAVGAGAFFLALLLGAVMLTIPASEIQLDTAAGADRVAGLRTRIVDSVEGAMRSSKGGRSRVDKALDLADINLRSGELGIATVGIFFVSFLVFSYLGGFVLGALIAVILALVPYLYLSSKVGRRRQSFANQLTDALGVLSGGLRAGRSLPQAVEYVAQESPSPIADEFRRIVFEARVGRDVTASMLIVAERMESEDFKWVAQAVDINREVGGDLTEVLDNVAETIRDRRNIVRQAQAQSAEGRATGWVLLVMPVLIFAFMSWRTPENTKLFLSDSLGRILLAVALTGMIVGYFWIRQLVNIKY